MSLVVTLQVGLGVQDSVKEWHAHFVCMQVASGEQVSVDAHSCTLHTDVCIPHHRASHRASMLCSLLASGSFFSSNPCSSESCCRGK